MRAKVNTNRLTKTFVEMVSIDSESGNEDRFANYMLRLGKDLGLKSRKDKSGNVYLLADGSGETIMFNTHMDTVSPGKKIKPRISGNYITSSGDTILGADSKAGIAAMIEMVRILKENKIKHRPFIITLTRNEESGIPTADKIVSEVKTCIVPDRGTPVGEIIVKAPFAQVFEVEVKGLAAYAPTDYSKGKHAIDAVIAMLSTLPRGDIDKETMVNIGIIQGGEMTSMTPAQCSFKGSCYSFSKKSLNNFLTYLANNVRKWDSRLGTKSTVRMLEYFGGYELGRNDLLVKRVENAVRGAGIAPKYKVYKAVTNANLLNQIGIKTVLISTGVENQHTTSERISIDSLVGLTTILTNIVIQ